MRDALFKKILVATHGTEGAVNAERYAIALAKALGSELNGIYVINKGWASLVGIEWLHPSNTRMEFYRYAETQFNLRADEVLKAFRERAADIKVNSIVKVGDPTDVIPEVALEDGTDLIVVGTGSNSRSEEYKARIKIKRLLKRAPCPVLLVTKDLISD